MSDTTLIGGRDFDHDQEGVLNRLYLTLYKVPIPSHNRNLVGRSPPRGSPGPALRRESVRADDQHNVDSGKAAIVSRNHYFASRMGEWLQ